jgi:hypothetical protein
MLDMLTSGLKVFILNSDLPSSAINYLQYECFLNGYEVYFYISHTGNEIEAFIENISEIFEESLVFINIDRKINGIYSYMSFLSRLNAKYLNVYQILDSDNVIGHLLRIGIIHSISPNRVNREVESGIERAYLEKAKLSGGFFAVDINQHRNARNFIDYLDSYEYLRGYKRHTVRYVCRRANERIKYCFKGAELEFKLLDISISHFSIKVSKNYVPEPYTKINNIQIYMESAIFKTDGLLSLVREYRGEEKVCVFIFLHPGSQASNSKKNGPIEMQGLDERNRLKLSNLIIEELQDSANSLLGRVSNIV